MLQRQRSGGRKKGRQLRPGSRIHYRASMRGHVTTSMPASQKKLKEGRTKYNEPKVEEVEKRILEVSAAEKTGSFEPRRERDVLTKVMGNPEHHGRICGVSLRQSRKDVEA